MHALKINVRRAGLRQRTSLQPTAFSLVEMMIAMFIFALLSFGITKTLLFTKLTAEDNLYEATSLTVAISTIEQMKGASLILLESPPKVGGKEVFSLVIQGNTKQNLILGEANILQVPIVTEYGGTTTKRMALTMIPEIEPMTTNTGYWLTVTFSYEHPRTGRIRTHTVRNARSTVPSS